MVYGSRDSQKNDNEGNVDGSDGAGLGESILCSGKPLCTFYEDVNCECCGGNNSQDERIGSVIV